MELVDKHFLRFIVIISLIMSMLTSLMFNALVYGRSASADSILLDPFASNILTAPGMAPTITLPPDPPLYVPVRSRDYTFTIKGTGFAQDFRVQFNNAILMPALNPPRVTSVSADGTSLTVLIPDVVAVAGNYQVRVGNNQVASNVAPFYVTNLKPKITEIVPATKKLSDSTFTLTVNGENFALGAKITIDRKEVGLATVRVSGQQLTKAITSDSIKLLGAGEHLVVVDNLYPGPDGASSNSVTFTITDDSNGGLTPP